MSARTATLIAAALLACAPAAAARSNGPPSRSQITAAVKRAERSRNLWATVNVCNTKRYRDVIGIRGQIPGLGFAAQLSMRFRVEYWSSGEKRFKAIRATAKSVSIGTQKTGLHQSGILIGFGPHAGSLRGAVTFQWRLAGKLIGQVSHTTTPGHASADFGDPRRYSSGGCVIS